MKKDFALVDDHDDEDEDGVTGDNALERFQNRFLKSYLFEIFGHELHLTEVLTGVPFLLSAVTTYMAGNGLSVLPAIAVSCIFIFSSIVSLTFLWGLVNVYSLAEIADKLDATAKRSTMECEQYKSLNNVLEEQNNTYGKRLTTLGKEVGVIDGDARKLESLIAELRTMQDLVAKLNQEQIQMGDVEDAFAEEQQQAVLDEKLELKKEEFKLAFKYITAETNNVACTPTQIETLKQTMDTMGIPWTSKCVEAASDGAITKYEMLDIIDEALGTRIHRMKQAKRDLQRLEKELDARKRKKLELECKLAANRLQVLSDGDSSDNGESADSVKLGSVGGDVNRESIEPAVVFTTQETQHTPLLGNK